jgi:hypothetical protein
MISAILAEFMLKAYADDVWMPSDTGTDFMQHYPIKI